MTHLKISIGNCIRIYSSLELTFVLFSMVNMLEDISIFTLGLCLSSGCYNKVPLGWIRLKTDNFSLYLHMTESRAEEMSLS